MSAIPAVSSTSAISLKTESKSSIENIQKQIYLLKNRITEINYSNGEKKTRLKQVDLNQAQIQHLQAQIKKIKAENIDEKQEDLSSSDVSPASSENKVNILV